MKGLPKVLLVLLAPLMVSGCATTNDGLFGLNPCGVMGAGAGGVAGALVAEKAIAGVVPGVIVGAALGHMLCWENDADGDGVSDGADQCPDTPAGVTVGRDGCADADGDGVSDGADRCPNTPEGIPVDQYGCSPDSDGDGVANDRDECPNTLAGIQVNENGCAKCGQLLAALGNIGFDFGRTEIRMDDTGILREVVRAIENTDTAIRIEGHTDSIGSDGYNLSLSQQRAGAVRDYLISRGLSSSKILAVVGRGEGAPIASNYTDEGRQQNRRVEIITDCSAVVR